MEEIDPDIIRICDEQKFAPANVLDFVSMAERLKPHMAKHAVAAPDLGAVEQRRPVLSAFRTRSPYAG